MIFYDRHKLESNSNTTMGETKSDKPFKMVYTNDTYIEYDNIEDINNDNDNMPYDNVDDDSSESRNINVFDQGKSEKAFKINILAKKSVVDNTYAK